MIYRISTANAYVTISAVTIETSIINVVRIPVLNYCIIVIKYLNIKRYLYHYNLHHQETPLLYITHGDDWAYDPLSRNVGPGYL